MKRIVLTLVSIIAAISATNAQNVTKSYDLGGFSAISAGNAFDIEVTKDNNYAVTLDIPESYLNYLVIEKREGSLVIGLKNTLPKRLSNLKESCKAYVSMPELRGIYLTGASKVEVKDDMSISMGKMDIEIAGASKVTGLNINAPEVEIEVKGTSRADVNVTASKVGADISGASKLNLTGSTKEFELELTGASVANTKDLTADIVEVESKGASKSVVYAGRRLKVELAGASRCEYYAPDNVMPEIEGISGASSVHRAK